MKPPTLSPRRQRNYDAMKQSILDAAREIMRADGVAALTMQELARKVEIRPPSLYHYFASKMEIYDTLFRYSFQLFGEAMQNAGERAGSFLEDLRLSMEAYMTFALENPDLFQLCFERHVPGFIPSEESMKVSIEALKRATGRINARLERGEFSLDMPLPRVMDLTSAMMHGLVALHLANEPHLPLGQGRFGSLIPDAVSVFEKAWIKK
jgi:AcrR family transcriptional regulator